MFNDDVQMGFFDVYDQYLLNILYDPRVRAGMTKEEVNRLLPEVLPTVRAWVTNANPALGANRREAPDAQAETAALPRSINTQTRRATGTN